MAEIKLSSGLVAERARILDDPRDKSVPAVDDGKPKDEMHELSSWVMGRIAQWRDHRRQNYEFLWDEYERHWRGLWSPIDKSRKSERSTLITPGLGNRSSDLPIDYASNVYSQEPPAGGDEATRLDVYIAWLNQSAWVYDPIYQSWWRDVDEADPQTAGLLDPEVDRLTNRQLHFENVTVLFAEHEVISPTNLSIHLEQDWVGNALLFRDGKKYDIRWNTVASEEEIRTGRRKPILFLYPDDKTPFPLKPGHTWIVVVTPKTAVTEKSPGTWPLQFDQPPGAK